MLQLVPLLKEDLHPFLSSALMEGAMQAIDKICSDVCVLCVYFLFVRWLW